MSELGLEPLRDKVMKQKVCDFCNALVQEATSHPYPIRNFPGTMALSLSRRHLQMIANNDYVALEKSDGVRYMLLALPNFVALIDRRMTIYAIDPNPNIMSFNAPGQMQENTLLDGELTYNMALKQWEYLIYDVVSIEGDVAVAKIEFRQRLRAAELLVAAPRVWSPMVSGLLRLRVKDFYEKNDLRGLFAHIFKNREGEYVYINHSRRDGIVCNLNDGVIFTPCRMAYQVKNCPALLKWKPPHLNSIDFALQLERAVDPRSEMPTVKAFIAFRSDKGNVRLREVFFPSKLRREWAASFAKYHNSIVELAYDRKCGEWRYIRQRDDKEVPNYSTTVIDTMESIAENMDREELTVFLELNGNKPASSSVAEVIQDVRKERAKNTYKDDLFDHNNLAYAVTTPMSLVKVPEPRTQRFGRDGNRGPPDGGERASGGRASGRNGDWDRHMGARGSGGGAANQNENGQEEQSSDPRLQPYDTDV